MDFLNTYEVTESHKNLIPEALLSKGPKLPSVSKQLSTSPEHKTESDVPDTVASGATIVPDASGTSKVPGASNSGDGVSDSSKSSSDSEDEYDVPDTVASGATIVPDSELTDAIVAKFNWDDGASDSPWSSDSEDVEMSDMSALSQRIGFGPMSEDGLEGEDDVSKDEEQKIRDREANPPKEEKLKEYWLCQANQRLVEGPMEMERILETVQSRPPPTTKWMIQLYEPKPQNPKPQDLASVNAKWKPLFEPRRDSVSGTHARAVVKCGAPKWAKKGFVQEQKGKILGKKENLN